MVVQSVIFKKTKWTKSNAKEWLLSHGYVVVKVDETTNYYRYRQKEPPKSKKSYYITKLKNGVELVQYY